MTKNTLDMTNTTVAAELCAQAKALCRAVAPLDLAPYPLYIIPASRTTLAIASTCDGFTSPNLDLYLSDALDWKGRGPCIVVNDIALASWLEADDIPPVFLGVALHELSHVLERGWTYRERQDVERIAWEAHFVAKKIAQSEQPEAPPEPMAPTIAVPWANHDDRFHRVVIHVHYRALLAGADVRLSEICPARYGLTLAGNYQDAMGDEPSRCLDLSFRDILARQAPREFAELFLQDTSRWFHFHERSNNESGNIPESCDRPATGTQTSADRDVP